MICPHCKVGIRFEAESSGNVHKDSNARGQMGFDIAEGFCPECHKFLVVIRRGQYYEQYDSNSRELTPDSITPIFPPPSNGHSIAPEIPEPYRNDFGEAVAIVDLSPKASAAISRRILQQILRDELKITHKTLDQEINEFIEKANVPTHLINAVDAVRQIGNFAAHPIKDKNTGEVLSVEPGEAEWLLDVLESLFDFVFVQPILLATKKDALNKKLTAAGKPLLK